MTNIVFILLTQIERLRHCEADVRSVIRYRYGSYTVNWKLQSDLAKTMTQDADVSSWALYQKILCCWEISMVDLNGNKVLTVLYQCSICSNDIEQIL